jgi:hypothetical protein
VTLLLTETRRKRAISARVASAEAPPTLTLRVLTRDANGFPMVRRIVICAWVPPGYSHKAAEGWRHVSRAFPARPTVVIPRAKPAPRTARMAVAEVERGIPGRQLRPGAKGATPSVKPSVARERSGWYWSTVAGVRDVTGEFCTSGQERDTVTRGVGKWPGENCAAPIEKAMLHWLNLEL